MHGTLGSVSEHVSRLGVACDSGRLGVVFTYSVSCNTAVDETSNLLLFKLNLSTGFGSKMSLFDFC